MEYEQFVQDVKHCLCWKVDGDYEVKVNHVIKNNSVALDGILLFKEGINVSPNIYLNSYYEQHKDGKSLEEIADDIIEMYHASMVYSEEEMYDLDFSYERMKSKIIYRLVNFKKNEMMLEHTPHIRFLDLAIVFCCMMKQDYTGIGTIRITNEHMNEWGVEVKDLIKMASINTPRMFPIKIRTMNDVIREMLQRDFSHFIIEETEDICPEVLVSEMIEEMVENMGHNEETHPMYILTNEIGINGASTLLYKEALYRFAMEKDCDFYILPSSIHEVILVPKTEELDTEELQNMVKEVNQTQVAIEEVLSDKVYVYNRLQNRIQL